MSDAPKVSVVGPRLGSAERFAHKAITIVNTALVSNAERNERSLATARLVLCLGFAIRLAVLFPQDLLAGQFKDWLVMVATVGAALLCAAHLIIRGPAPPQRYRQRAFVAVDLMLFCVALFPAVLWPEPNYMGLLMTPFVGLGTLVAVAGGMRLRRQMALVSSFGMVVIVITAGVLDWTMNADVVTWGVGEVVFYAVELGGAAVLGVVIADRTLALATESARAAIDAERARERLGAYVGREVAEASLRSDEIVMGGVRQPVAVLFSDLRGFTTYAEKLPPEALVTQLNNYLEEMVAVITRHGGVVDKYIGDGIMAVFGAPSTRDDDAARAITVADALVTALASHNRRRATDDLPPLRMGIGVHYGTVVAGNIGTIEHAQYTIIGDVVNLASRLESATKDMDVSVLISEAAKDAAGASAGDLVPLGSIAVRGRDQAVSVFGLASEARPVAAFTDGNKVTI